MPPWSWHARLATTDANILWKRFTGPPKTLTSMACGNYCLVASPLTLRPILLRAGADLPAETNNPYIQKVIDAGGWANYERLHLDRLTAMLTPKDDDRRRSRLSPLRRVPPEVLRKIAALAFHAGFY